MKIKVLSYNLVKDMTTNRYYKRVPDPRPGHHSCSSGCALHRDGYCHQAKTYLAVSCLTHPRYEYDAAHVLGTHWEHAPNLYGGGKCTPVAGALECATTPRVVEGVRRG